ncbi:IniB N-terminal domain-containing protein [Saccharothrix violaceirubra]|uniref:Uncharacterized protein n=1 Tax=Saccharothrix violaceirubra TaxID=413306 RepID=A0A7W7TBC6_9PSEU|nr:IniB N-terminal domain-containing protein [Saccharothrix violaceirubra]MBB4968685.1 hypothetical protein [Saccharothrix violaceirubra]
MGSSAGTLHDFVLDLLSDPDALADFQADAEGSLAAAGLGDITAQDVQEVIPLVLDYAPAGRIPALDQHSMFTDVPLDDATSAVGQLQAVAQQLALSGVTGTSDVNLAAAGALSADAHGLEIFGGYAGWGAVDSVGSISAAVDGDFAAVHDVTSTLDRVPEPADVAGQATAAVPDVVPDTGTLPVPAATTDVLGPLHSTIGNVVGTVTDSVALDLDHDTAGLGVGQAPDLGQVTAPLESAAPVAVSDVTGHGVTDVDHADVPVVSDLGDLLF